jgi:hypothetical protein
LLIIQSCMLRSQSSSRSRPNSGIHRILRATAIIGSRSGSIEMNHSSTRRNTSWLPHRQHIG